MQVGFGGLSVYAGRGLSGCMQVGFMSFVGVVCVVLSFVLSSYERNLSPPN